MKNSVKQEVLKEAPEKGCADLCNPDMNMVKWLQQQLRTMMSWEFILLYLSLLKVVPKR